LGTGSADLTTSVAPPLAHLDIPFRHFKLSGDEPTTFQHHTGSTVRIPAGAFVDQAGQPVHGEVEVRYREFHDPLAVLLSGIPMHYDSAQTRYHFESAGMLQIEAFQDGEPVLLHPDKSLEVAMHSKYPGSHFNLYQLDTTGKGWQYRGKDSVTAIASLAAAADGSVPGQAAALSAEQQVEQALQAHRAQLKTNSEDASARAERLEAEWETAKADVASCAQTQPVQPQALNPKRTQIELDVLPKEFPELDAFGGALFELADGNPAFQPIQARELWEDVALKRAPKAGVFNIVFSKGNSTVQYRVYPVFRPSDMAKAQRSYAQRFEAYEQRLADRQATEEQQRQNYEAALARQEALRAELAAPLEELRKEWQARAEARLKEVRNDNMLRTFRVNALGVWNCDHPAVQSGTKVLATFKTDDGEALRAQTVYLLNRTRNSVIPYSLHQRPKIVFNPDWEHELVAILPDKRLARFAGADFEQIPAEGGDYTFTLQRSSTVFETMDQVADFLGFARPEVSETEESPQDNS
ncbi:MAG: OmpH family outer membrane protein, partial [Bacteroidota bacterium]